MTAAVQVLIDGAGDQPVAASVVGAADASPASELTCQPRRVLIGGDADDVTGRQRTQPQQPVGTGEKEVHLAVLVSPASLQRVEVGVEHAEDPVGDVLWTGVGRQIPPV